MNYNDEDDLFYGPSKESKRIAKILELDSLYRQLESHMNMVLGCQYLLAFAFCFLIWQVEQTRSIVMEYPGFLVVSGSILIVCMVAVRFFFLQIRDAPLNISVLFCFSLSKVYLFGFILCVCHCKEYLIGLFLLVCDFWFAFGMVTLTKNKGNQIIESVLVTLITAVIFGIYQLTIMFIVSKKKFGNKDYLLSSIFLYALWLIPFSPEEA